MRDLPVSAAALVLVCLCLPCPSQARLLYVAKSGSDASAGTESAPWATVGKAAQATRAGDTVFIRSGTYNERLSPKNSGTATAPIVFSSYPGDSVVLDAKGTSGEAVVTISGIKHVRVAGLTLTNGHEGIGIINASHVTVYGNHTYNTVSSGVIVSEFGVNDHIRIDSNDIELACNNGAQECISVSKCDSFEISRNHVHHGGPGSVGGEGIDCKFGCKNGVIRYNHVHHLSRQGIYADAWSVETSNLEFYGNVVHDCPFGIGVASETGGTLRKVIYHNNLVYNCSGPGIYILVSAGPLADISFVNNTVHYCGYGWGGGMYFNGSQSRNVVVRNNVFSRVVKGTFDMRQTPTGLTIDHNLTNKDDPDHPAWFIKGVARFVDTANADFHLLQTSPGIDAGNDSALYNVQLGDLEGNCRIQDGDDDGEARIDLGAYEYGVAGSPVKSPLHRAAGSGRISYAVTMAGNNGFRPSTGNHAFGLAGRFLPYRVMSVPQPVVARVLR